MMWQFRRRALTDVAVEEAGDILQRLAVDCVLPVGDVLATPLIHRRLDTRQIRVQCTAITTGTCSVHCNHDRYIVHVRVQRTAITTSKCSAYYNVQSRQLRNQRTTTTAYTSSWHCNQKFTAIADLGMHYSGYLPRITGRQC